MDMGNAEHRLGRHRPVRRSRSVHCDDTTAYSTTLPTKHAIISHAMIRSSRHLLPFPSPFRLTLAARRRPPCCLSPSMSGCFSSMSMAADEAEEASRAADER